MPNANSSQKLDEISKELEALRAQSLSHPEKAAEMLQDGLEQLQVSLKELTDLVGGMTGAEQVEEALRESEARLRSIAKAGRIGLFEWNASKDTAYWSPEHYELFGLEPDSPVSWQRWFQGLHPEDRERVVGNAARLLERARSEGGIQGHKDEYRFIRPDGSLMWVGADLSADMVGGGIIIRGSVRDITDRKMIEEALGESEKTALDRLAEIEAYYNTAPIGLCIFDTNLRYLRINERLAEINGLPASEHLGRTVREVIPALADQAEKLARQIIDSGQPAMKIEFTGETAAQPGVQRTWLESWFPLKDGSGQIKGINVVAMEITDRKKAEEALRKSEANMARAQKIAHLGNWEWDLKTNALSGSDEHYRMYGLEPGNYPMDTLINLVHEDDRQYIRDSWLAALYEGKPYDVECRVVRPDGSIAILHGEGEAIFNENGQLKGMFGIAQDITEQKKAEEELRKSEERYRLLFEQANDGIAIHMLSTDREESKFIQVNDAICRMLGYTREEMLQISPLDIQDKEELADIPAETNVLDGERKLHFEKTLIGRDGRKITADIHSTVFNLKGNQVVLSIIRDITERKQIDEALRKAKDDLEQNVLERTAELTEANLALKESEDRFRVTLKNAPLVVFNQDRDLRYTWLYNPNPAFTQDTAIGKTDEELLPPEDAAQLTKIKRRVLESGYGERAEVRTTFNGEEFFYDLTVEPLRSGSGEIEGITCASMDITYRKKAEEEMKRAREAAEAAARAKSEFLANMSHEIRTPMNAIIGMTALILDEPMDPVQRENLELVRTNGDALLTIINDMLDFSKMESDKLVLEEQIFNLRSCVEESIDLIAIKAAEKGLNLAYSIDKNVPEAIIGDSGRLRQVMGNLLSNAVKFTDKGEVTLSVSIDESNEVHFAVLDTGIGIPQGSMHQLFQPFSQMEPSTTRLYGGTGLGLAISKKLVEQMGGRIWAESHEGIGSTFHFAIKAPSNQSEIETSAVSPQMIGRHVLIVEDNKTNRRILSKQVYDWGMIPMAASSGQEALNWIRRGDDFDIAILDMDLQDIGGLELEDEIRKYNRTLPLVFLVSLGKRIPPNHAYLTKPIKPSKLYQVMIDILLKGLAKRPVQQVLASQPIQNHPLRILIAEDNTSHQKVAQQMLKRLGYKAGVVANGIEALHALERQHYDVVFMDVKMPVMDGLEATRIIRQRWPHEGPKIIALTAYGLKGDRERFISAGMDDYILKPVQKEDLAKVLRRYG